MFYAFTIHGEIFTISGTQLDEKLLCAECLAKKEMKGATRCALCGKRIRSGKMVALYQDGPMFRADAVRVDYDGRACVMGCHLCAPEGVLPVGKWNGESFAPQKAMGGLMDVLIKELGLCSMCDSQTCTSRREPYTGQQGEG